MGEAPQGRTNFDPETVMNQIYLDAVRLLLDVTPAVFRNSLFALKGGTAINLFVRKKVIRPEDGSRYGLLIVKSSVEVSCRK